MTLHHSFAYVVVLFAAVLLAVSFGAKVTRGARWAALAIFAVALPAGRRAARPAPVPGVPASVSVPPGLACKDLWAERA